MILSDEDCKGRSGEWCDRVLGWIFFSLNLDSKVELTARELIQLSLGSRDGPQSEAWSV